MTNVTRARLLVAGIGIITWLFGHRYDDSRLRWAGIVFLVVAIAMRFLEHNRGRRH